MATAYVGEIRIFGGNFAPVGWQFCDGSLISISQNAALFELIGTTYGGNGTTNFALPDLRGRVPIHQGDNGISSYVMGQLGGEANVTLTNQQLPGHSHTFPVSSDSATADSPKGNIPAAWSVNQYLNDSNGAATTDAMAAAVGVMGQSLPHDNQLPVLAVNFIISMFGVFPTQN